MADLSHLLCIDIHWINEHICDQKESGLWPGHSISTLYQFVPVFILQQLMPQHRQVTLCGSVEPWTIKTCLLQEPCCHLSNTRDCQNLKMRKIGSVIDLLRQCMQFSLSGAEGESRFVFQVRQNNECCIQDTYRQLY